MAEITRLELLEILRMMVLIRTCEESLVEPIINQEFAGPVHLYSGQEAIAVGICRRLEKKDTIFGNHRSHGHFLAKGGDVETLVAEVYAVQSGCSGGRGGSMHLQDRDNGMLGSVPIVAGTVSLAAGAALAHKYKNTGGITVSFFGDGAMGEGVVYETMNCAVLMKLPILFVCENNLYSTHMPISRCRAPGDIYTSAASFGMSAVQLDGMDVREVTRVAGDLIRDIREGQGPAFIECMTYRYRGHVGASDKIQGQMTDIRNDAEREHWEKRDPIDRLVRYLQENSLADIRKIDEIKTEVKSHVMAAIALARRESPVSADTLKDHVYV